MTSATWRTIFLAAVGLFVLWLAYLARTVVTPLLVALLLAYILDPVVQALERRGLSRSVASFAIVVVVLATLAGVAAVAATRLVSEASGFYDRVVGEPSEETAKQGEFEKRMLSGVPDDERAATIGKLHRTRWNGKDVVYYDRDGDGKYEPGYAAVALSKVQSALPMEHALENVKPFGPQIAESVNAALTGLVQGGHAVFSGFLGLFALVILFPICLYYSLVNLARVYDVTVRHLPTGQRARIVGVLHQIHVTLSAFFRGRLIMMLVKGVLLLGLYLAFGVPFSYVCAAFGALASLVPVVGGVVAAVPPIALSLPVSSGGEVVGLAVGILVIEAIEGYVLIPTLIGRRVGLHPLTVLVCALIAGDLLGLFGMIVAVPLTAVLKILVTEFVLPEIRRRAGLDPRPERDAASGNGPPDGHVRAGVVEAEAET